MDKLFDIDNQIIGEVRAGNSRRYGQLIDRHKDKAVTLALRLTGSREEAEELVQDAFLRAFRSLDRFRGDAKFSTWFYRILYNLCMTRVTRRKGKPEVRTLGGDNEQRLNTLKVDEEDLTIHERLEQEELQEIIAQEIDRLPGNYKSAVTLFYVQEMSYEEISVVQDLPLGTVKTNLFRGRNLLRERVTTKLKGEMKVA